MKKDLECWRIVGWSRVPGRLLKCARPSGFLSTTTPTAVGMAANFYCPHALQDKQILRMSSTLSKVITSLKNTEKDSVFAKGVPCFQQDSLYNSRWGGASLSTQLPKWN